jgi:hypothetical protein
MERTGNANTQAFAASFLRAFFTDILHNIGKSAQTLR